MTDRKAASARRAPVGNAGRILVTGVSIAAGLGLIGAFESASATGATEVPPPTTQPQAVVVRRVVVVPTPQPDIVLRSDMAGAPQVVQRASAPVIRVRPAATVTANSPAGATVTAPAPVTTTSGSR